MKTLKTLSIVLFILFAFTSCEKENLDSEIIKESVFPERLSATDFFQLLVNTKDGKYTGISDIGALNETEWFLKDLDGNIQYYELDSVREQFAAISTFSGKVVDFKQLEREASNGRIAAAEVCSYSYGGCTQTVEQGWVSTTYTIQCGSLVEEYTFPGYQSLLICAALALNDAIYDAID